MAYDRQHAVDTGAHHCLFDAATRDTLAAYVREDEQRRPAAAAARRVTGLARAALLRGEVCEDDVG